MNTHMHERSGAESGTESGPDLMRYLSGLPAPAATPGLWSRIEGTRQRRRRRRQLFGVGGAAAAVAVLTLLSVQIGRPGPQPTRIAQAQSAAIGVPADPRQPDLRHLDLQLQAAYDGAADPEQLNALWQARALATTPIDQENQRHDAIIRL